MGSGFRHIAVVLSPSVIRRASLGALVVIFMSACASTVRMSELDFPLDTARIKIIVDQQQLEPQRSRGSAGATLMFGHLVGAAVMSHQDTQAELFIAPMRERLKEIDLGDLFLSRIVEAHLLDQFSQNAQVEIFRMAPENNTAAFYDGRFVILPSIRMTHDMRMLLVSLELAYITTESTTMPRQKTHFQNTYQFAWPVVESDFYRLDRGRAIEAWASWSDEELLQLIETGIATSLRMLKANLLDPRPQTQSARFDPAPTEIFYGARIWHVEEDAVWLTSRFAHMANFYAMPRSSLRRSN
jgi:hypothetical protein